jgi:alkanesulfonate monooxygenase SsuD/methylene tetrahydromethanopterin reductase-like flavin-dependent oxidoreductase (luciferase family)
VKFSLWLWPYDRWQGLDAMAEAARRAEELGFASVSVSDHTICTTGPESDGVTPFWPDWSVLSTYLATRTNRIRILTSLVVPYRPVLPTAKQIATIDLVSGGRFILAAAVGWLRPEFEMLGVSYEQRGSITDEYLFEPKCVQEPHVPIWVAGGAGPAPIRRLLELGDGWMPMGGDLDSELREAILRIKERALERGRDPDALTFRYTIGIGEANPALESISKSISVDDPATVGRAGSPEAVADQIARFERAGFTELAINFSGGSAAEVMDQLDWFGSEVLPKL